MRHEMASGERLLDALIATRALTIDRLLSWYDTLPAVTVDELIGDWSGGVFDTGHPGEQKLDALAWVGKRFTGPDTVDPIVSRGADGERVANPVLGAARLRRVEHRGVVTATMIYDDHPILDHFRRVSGEAVLGVMDRKGDTSPLFFYLRRLR